MIHWKKSFKYIVFLLIGLILFWYVYKDIKINEIRSSLTELKIGWIILSFLLGLLSHFFRAIRWRMLITHFKYKPRISNLFLSVLILYFTNLIIPRGGEIARCGIISKYEKIPFIKLLGSVIVERLTDMLAFFLIFAVILLWQYPFISDVLKNVSLTESVFSKLKYILPVGIAVMAMIIWAILKSPSLRLKINRIKNQLIDGLSGIRKIERPFVYVAYTFMIFFLWLMMLYVVFFAYPPTNHLTFSAAILTYTVGTLAYLLPIQAGIGAWHFLVVQCLFLFGLDQEYGIIFALIAHTFTNLIYLVFGALGFVLLPLTNAGYTAQPVDQDA